MDAAGDPNHVAPARPGTTVRVAVRRYGADPGERTDEVATEEPLEIRVSNPDDEIATPVSVTMRTPGHDFELAAGFVLSEGIATRPEEIRGLRYCTLPDEAQQFNVVNVDLRGPAPIDLDRFRRNIYTASSCGICGRATLDRVRLRGLAAPPKDVRFAEEMLRSIPARVAEQQPIFARTGGVHATALLAPDGRVRLVREDVGRHNAFDKVVGALALEGSLPAHRSAAFVSGRPGFELVQKAVVAGIPLVAGVGAPTHLAVDLAREFDVTLVGFLRPTSFNVYAVPERIVERAAAVAPGLPPGE